jgi:hypothetical protein
LRDLFVRQAVDIREDDDEAPVLRQLTERLLELPTQFAPKGVGLGRWAVVGRVDVRSVGVFARGIEGALRSPALAPELVPRGVRHDTQEPRPESIALEAADAAVGAQEGFLCNVFGGLGDADEAKRKRVCSILMTEYQKVERV